MSDNDAAGISCTKSKLARRLQNRHIQMIALGSAIGIGFFYGSGEAVAIAGPAVLLSYLIGGFFIYLVMRMLGEMAAQEPVAGSFSYFAYRYWGDFAGFLSGWNYWFLYILISIAELSVIGLYLDYWLHIDHWKTAFAVLFVITLINLTAVRSFGEFEFWLSSIKVATVLAMIGFGTFLIITGFDTSSSVTIANLWKYGGFFPHGISGMVMGLVVVMFSFGGAELIGIAAAETDKPEKTIPKALQQFMWRILLFYLAAIAIIMILMPWSSLINIKASPFVLVFDKIGIKWAADIINFVVITAAVSVFNSACYSNGRMLFALAEQHNAPQLFMRLSRRHVPYVAILFSSFCTAMGLVLYYCIPNGEFLRILAIVTAAAIVTWSIIILVHLRFRQSRNTQKSAPGEGDSLIFKAWFYPYGNYACLAFLSVLFILMLATGFTADGLFTRCFALSQPLVKLPVSDISVSALIIPLWIGVLYCGFCLKKLWRQK